MKRLCVALCMVAVAAHADEYQSAITYKGKIKESITVKAKVNGKDMDIVVVNGFLPDEILEGTTKGIGITFHNFIFNAKPTKYEKGKKYKYVFKKKGISVTESVSKEDEKKEKVTNEYSSNLYQLEKQ